MYWHTPVAPRGPATRARAWWNALAEEPHTGDESGPPGATAVMDEEIRADLVARVRQEIAEGRYDTPEKWNAAVDQLLARMA